MKFKNLIINCENDSRIHQMFRAVVELMPLMPELEKLIDEATKNGPITVDFVSRSQLDTTGCYQERGVIRGNHKSLQRFIKIAKDGQSFRNMFETLVFELNNAKNPSFQLFGKDHISPEKYANREAYALATEFAEYSNTHVPSKKLLKSLFTKDWLVDAFSAKGLRLTRHDLLNLTHNGFHSFNDWWNHVNKNVPGRNYSHADVYRQQFDKKMPHVPKQPTSIQPKLPTVKPVVNPAPKAKQTPVVMPLCFDRHKQRCVNGRLPQGRQGGQLVFVLHEANGNGRRNRCRA
ncbi:MAG: hypothetical protein HYX61_03195 [Gammaproteobacteria bacterium]|jgi:hypothetical protein|nr:hypothetical protein [Gammaproteobacteria bacterium]